jgi:hypothetical protein
MTLNETILSILSDSDTMSVDAVIRVARSECRAVGIIVYKAQEIVNALGDMERSGEIVHSFGHGGSQYRKRTPYQLEQWRAVQEKRQPELL